MKTINQKLCSKCGHRVEEHDDNGCHHNEKIAATATAVIIAAAVTAAFAVAAAVSVNVAAVAAIIIGAVSATVVDVAVEYIRCDCSECIEHKHVFACRICGKENKQT